MMSKRFLRSSLIPLLLAAVAVSAIASRATNPVSGTPDLVLMSEAKEIEIGRTNFATTSPLGNYGESTLRLINDKFPDGEPQAGEFIKIIQ